MRRFTSVLFIAIVLTHVADLQAQQTFHVLRAGSSCGRLSLDFESMSNGYRQCELREERRYQDVDGKSVTWRRVLTVLVDSALRTVSLNGREFTRDNEFRIKGSRVQGTLFLTTQDKHGALSSSREDGAAVPDVFLPFLTRETDLLLPDKVFFTRDLVARKVHVRDSTAQDGTQYIEIEDGSVLSVAADGTLLTWAMPSVGLAYSDMSLPVSGVEPCDIACGVYWDAGQVSLPTPVENVRAMKLRLTLTREVGARLVPEDLRQSFDTQNTQAAQVEVQLRRVRQRHGEATIPVREEAPLAYLGESPLLAVTSDALRERVAALRATTRDIATIAGEIQNWMGISFIPDAFVPVVSADRLVRTPRGTSLHAAVLAVALARAAGVPARLVLGVLPQQGRWRSSVWMEAWSGEWLSIDPVTGEFIDDPVHIKLLHSMDESELFDQANRLRGALRIDILEVTEIDTSPAGGIRTGVVDGVYSDRSFRFSMRAPEGWIVEHREKGVETEVLLSPETGADVRCEVLLSRYPYPVLTQDAFDAKVRALAIVLKEVEVAERGEIRIGGRKVPYVLYSYRDTRPGAGDGRITTADCIFTISERGYQIRFTAPSEDFQRFDPVLKDILQNVVLYE